MMPQTSLGVRIHTLRWQQRLSLRQLARRSGVSAASIQRLERGRDGSISHLFALAYALGIDAADMLKGVNTEADVELWENGNGPE